MSYYTDKILNNYNKSKTNYNYNEEDSDEEESEVMTEQYESESNDNLDNKYSYGGGNYSNPYGGINNSKQAATGGISKYLNPGKLMSSGGATNTYTANKFEKKSNPYARSATADPYGNDTYNIDIDLNKIRKDSETFHTNNYNTNKTNKADKADKNKKRSISYGWSNDKDLKENDSEDKDDSGKILNLIVFLVDEQKYDLPDEIVIDRNKSYKDNIGKKGKNDSDYQLKNEEEINKFLNEDIDSESEYSRSKKDMKKLPVRDNAKKTFTKSHSRSLSNKSDSVSINESIKSKSKSKIDSYYEECASKLNDKSKSEISGEIKDSTISIDYYMDKSESKNKSKIKELQSNTHSIQNAKDNLSRSQITKSEGEKEIGRNNYNEQSQDEDYSYNKLNNSRLDKEEYLRKTAAFATGGKIDLKEERVSDRHYNEEFNSREKRHDTITSDADDKYNDFISASKLDNQSVISENEVDIYNQFDEISSNLPLDISHDNTPSITYNNFGNSMTKTIPHKEEINLQGKSSQNDKENNLKSNIYEMKSRDKSISNKDERQEQHNNQENIQNVGRIDTILSKNSQDTGIIFTNSNNNNNHANMNNRSFDLKFNNEYIQNIIIEEFKKLISPISNSAHIQHNPYSDLLNKLNLINSGSLAEFGGVARSVTSSSPLPVHIPKTFNSNHNSNSNNNPTNLPYAREEVTNRIVSYLVDKSANFLIYSDSHNKLKTFDVKLLKVYSNEEIVLYRATPPKRDIREMKLQLAIEEERKEKEFHKMNYYKSKETIEDFEIKLKKFRKLEIENSEIKKINLDTEAKYEELEKDYRELKIDYDNKVKFVEERVILRESKSENKKVIEISRNFEIEIENLKNEIKEKNTDLEEYKNKCEYFEGLNTKLSLNKFSNIETNDKIKELRGENFILHEKCNELMDKLEKSLREKEKLEKKLFHKEIFSEVGEEKDFSEKVSSNNFKKIIECASKSNSVQNQFDQILIEREFNVQETIIKSYIKEIERLNKEISFLKNITLNTGTNAEKQKYIFPRDNQNFSKTKNQKLKNNFVDNRDKNLSTNNEMDIAELNSQESDYPENNFVKESAQAKIKLLKKFLSSGDKNLDIANLENEFLILEKSKIQNKNKSRVEISDSEFDLETFLAILQKFDKNKNNNNKNIPLSKYELIEIFNNFPRTSKNKIRLSDFIHALKSSKPYNYFIQPDPHYLTELESKVIKYENILTKLEKEKEELKKNEIDLKNKNSELESEKKEFGKKINELTNFNENCMGMFMKNINMNMNSSNAKFPDNTIADFSQQEEVKKLNEKIKNLEKENSAMKLNSYKEFETKIFQYEEKFKTLSEKNLSCQNLSQENQKINLQLNSQIKDLEYKNKNINEKIEEKLLKYKQNYRILKEKLILSEKEKEKFFKVLNQNLIGDEKLSSQKIQNFFMNSDQIDSIVQKIETLESRNKEREEYYRQLCYKANNYQVNKEIETVTKKFELERKEYFKIINQKNSELNEIKKEFEEMLKQLEEIKSNKRFNRV